MTGDSPADHGDILILGAGPTGLGAAYRLEELGIGYRILEAAGGPGGLASSFVDDAGYTWDLGGHVQFSHYSYYDDVLDRALDGWLWHERESWVWIDGRFVPYPFQYNVHRLEPGDRDRALAGLEAAAAAADSHEGRPAHFKEWIDRTFGDGIAEVFLYPYNFKVWGYPLETMSAGWVGERVAVPDVERVRRNIEAHADDVSWGPNNRFRFPEAGGTGAIWKAVASTLPEGRILAGRRATSIDLDARTVTVSTGDGEETHAYGSLLSTIPIDLLVGMSGPLPDDVRQAARGMVHSSVHVLGVGLKGEQPDTLGKKCWMYFPEDASPYYRVTVFSNYSPNHVPGPGCWSLMAEVCESPHRPVDVAGLEEWTLRAMREDGLIAEGTEVVHFWHHRLEHGYPTPFVGRDERLAVVHPALQERSVWSRGRFGGWRYEVANQDHSFMQGVEWANHVARGEPEVTYHDPARANSGEFLKK